MKSFVTALLFGFAAATPLVVERAGPPGGVKISKITAIGSGCPAGHAYVNVDSTGTIFDVAFDQYTVEVGPGISASNNRKNCRISLTMDFPQGFQFTVMDTTFSGYASLARGQTGTLRAAYSFSGGGGEAVAQQTIGGPADKNYRLAQGVDIVSYSRCGDHSAILNVNSEIRVTPVNTPSKGSMTVDSFDGRLHMIFAANWRSC